MKHEYKTQKGKEQAYKNPFKKRRGILGKLLKLHACLYSHLELQINNCSQQKTSDKISDCRSPSVQLLVSLSSARRAALQKQKDDDPFLPHKINPTHTFR